MKPTGNNNKERLYILMAQHTDNHGNVYPWDHLYNHYYRKEKIMFDKYKDVAFGNQFAGMFFHEVSKDMEKINPPCACCVSKPKEDRIDENIAPKPVIKKIFKDMGKEERNFNIGGTYSQPVSFLLGEEAAIREFTYSKEDLENFYGKNTDMYGVSENTAATYMPQILNDLGFRSAIMRCHYAPLGFPPEYDESFILWQGSDGSVIPTIPTYKGDNRRRDFDGMNESEVALIRWDFEYAGMDKLEALDLYYTRKKEQGIEYVVMTCFEDTHFEDIFDDEFYKKLREVDPKGEKYVFCTPEQIYKDTPLLKADKVKYSSYSDWLFSMNNGYFGEEFSRKNNAIYHLLNDTEILRAFNAINKNPQDNSANKIIDEAYREHLMAQEHGTYECWGCFSLPNTQIKRATEAVTPIYEKAIENIVSNIKSDDKCNLAIINTQSFKRKELCKFEINCSKEQSIEKIIDNESGKELSFEINKTDFTDTDASIKGTVLIEIDAFSVKTLKVVLASKVQTTTGRPNKEMLDEIKKASKVFSTPYYNLELDENGEIKSVSLSDNTAILTSDDIYSNLCMNGRFFDMDTRDKFRDEKNLGKVVMVYEDKLSTVFIVKGKIDRADYGFVITIYKDLPYFDVNLVSEIDNNLGVGWMLPPESMGAEWGEANENQKYLRMCMNFNPSFKTAGLSGKDPYSEEYPLYYADKYNENTNMTLYTTFQPDRFKRSNVANTVPQSQGYRPNHIYDYTSQYFVDISDVDNSKGFTVITKGFSAGTYDGNYLKIVMTQNQHSARSGYLNEIYSYGCNDFTVSGNTRYELRILPHGKKSSATDCVVNNENTDVLKLSLAFQSKLISKQFGENSNGKATVCKFADIINNDNVIVSNLREENGSVFARAFEYKGEGGENFNMSVNGSYSPLKTYSMDFKKEKEAQFTKNKIMTFKLV